MSDISKRITSRRDELGMSMRELAKAVEVSPETIRKIESGETRSPRAILLGRIAKVLRLDLGYLLDGSAQTIQIKASGRTVEIFLPYEIILDSTKTQRLARRLAIEFDLIHEEMGG